MIKFEFYTSEQKDCTFGDVEENQFFIDDQARLCQKCSGHAFNVISDSDGDPWCAQREDMNHDMIIHAILPRVRRIRFEL